jgi:hypothetical protein
VSFLHAGTGAGGFIHQNRKLLKQRDSGELENESRVGLRLRQVGPGAGSGGQQQTGEKP